MHPISNRDVNFFILEFLLIIGFILYPFTIYNSRALHFVRNFFDIFWQILNFVDCHNYWRDFLCKEHTATKLPQYISPAKPHFLYSDIAIIPYAVFTYLQIPPRPDHLHGQNLPPRRTESAMLTEHYTTVVSNSPPELFQISDGDRHSISSAFNPYR